MTDSNMLRARALEKGYSIKSLSEKTGIVYRTLLSKVNNKQEFKASEIDLISKTLELSNDSRNLIFFNSDVAK